MKSKKIIISLGIIGIVAAAVIGGTIAYFNDTETSTGNIFVAGSIDLKVDHVKQTYNDVDCKTCSVNIFSSSTTDVTAGTGAFSGLYPSNAVELTYIHPNWIQSISDSSAKWIWVTDPVLVADTTNGAEYTFEKKFNWNGSIAEITLDLALAADNGYKIVFNGVTVADQLGTEHNYGALVNTSGAEVLMLDEVQNGENTLEITVRNKPGSNNPASNPAGLIFDLTVQRPENECEADSAFQQACRLWTEKDLDQGDTFFNFGDVKPGDYGTNLISLHVNDNDAWICLLVDTTADDDNGLVDPEVTANDTTDGSNAGELDNYLNVALWDDVNKDGIHDIGEAILYSGLLANADMVIAEGGETPVPGGETIYVGLAWCAGAMTADTDTAEITCDGSTMLDDAQTDSLMATLTAYAEQSRNNEAFDCASVILPN